MDRSLADLELGTMEAAARAGRLAAERVRARLLDLDAPGSPRLATRATAALHDASP